MGLENTTEQSCAPKESENSYANISMADVSAPTPRGAGNSESRDGAKDVQLNINDSNTAKNANIDPEKLAADIYKNVQAVYKNPQDAQSLENLHEEAQLLDGKGGWKGSTYIEDNNKDLQQAVQKDLNKLLKDGALPNTTILIDDGGAIYADKQIPGTHIAGGMTVHGRLIPGSTYEEPNAFEIQASKLGPTELRYVDGLPGHGVPFNPLERKQA